MKQTTQFFAIFIVALLILGGNSFAQDNEQPLLITSFNMVLNVRCWES